ncbi:hypothetical protein ACOMHN_051200 [Nucella lapillus]
MGVQVMPNPQTKPGFFSMTCGLCSRVTSDLSSHTHTQTSEAAAAAPTDGQRSEKGIGRFQDEQYSKMLLKPDQPDDARILRVAIIGLPNSGKSTLTNRLLGWRVSSVSSKVHTTRRNTTGIYTQGNTQIVFLDTPGILSATSRKRHNLERSLLIDPERSLHQADLVCVVVDASNKWTRNELDPLILQVLHLHQHIPATLILNKVDQLRCKEMLLQMTRCLTQGVVAGRPVGGSSKKSGERQVNMEALFDAMGHNRSSPDQPLTAAVQEEGPATYQRNEKTPDEPMSPAELPHKSGAVSEDEAWASYFPRIREACRAVQGLRGWPLFGRVFMVSALSGDGVEDVKDYLVARAVRGDWDYHSSLVTCQDPRDLLLQCVREKLLEHLRNEVPYSISLDTVLWEVDEDGMFNVIINAVAQSRRQVSILLGPKGQTIQKIASEAKQEMMNAFRCEMRLKIVAKTRQVRKR